jgi:hypothetical protein
MGGHMDITRKSHREAQAQTLEHRVRQEAMIDDELIEHKLAQLLMFFGQLERTPIGAAEIQRRIKLFGECQRSERETSAEFYAKLRHWLDRSIPRTKSLRHPARQSSDC